MQGLVTAAMTEQLEANGIHTFVANASMRLGRVTGAHHITHSCTFGVGANTMMIIKKGVALGKMGAAWLGPKDDASAGELSMCVFACLSGEHIHGALREHREARNHWFLFDNYALATQSFEHFWRAYRHHVRATRRWLAGAVVIAGRTYPAADCYTAELTDAAERLLDAFYEGWLQVVSDRNTPPAVWHGSQSAYDLARAVYVFTLVWMVGVRRGSPGTRPLGLDHWHRATAEWFTVMIKDLDPCHAYGIQAADGISSAYWKNVVPLNGWAQREVSGRAAAREARARTGAPGHGSSTDEHAAAAERDEGGRAPSTPRTDGRPTKGGGPSRA